ncbi:MAG TPA: hypothetical protein VFY06_01345 [Verrucomicrobiae bacterium]|nr:hypothetical protein [Verrucomicrobiae bacterium]
MNDKTMMGLIAAGLLAGGAAFSVLAQNGPGRGGNGRGYGGPPQTQEERAARQAACLERNGGVCPNGGPRVNCPGLGMGKGQGAGHGWRRGARDGTGPLAGTTNCPAFKQK